MFPWYNLGMENAARDVGRPTVMTDEVIRKLEEIFALGGTDLEACLFADISKSTLYDYQVLHPEFVERKEKLKEEPILKARRTVVGALDQPNMALSYLERKKKDEFSMRVENTGKDGTPLQISLVQYGDNNPPQV